MANSKAKMTTIPKGLRAITATISVADPAAALQFYTDVMGAEITDQLTAPDSEILLQAQIKLGGTPLIIVRDETALPSAGTGPVTLHFYLDALEETYDAALAAGAVPVAPVAATWWGDLNGVFIDPFGIRWSLAKRVERLNADERNKRLRDLYLPTPATDQSPTESNAEIDPQPVSDATQTAPSMVTAPAPTDEMPVDPGTATPTDDLGVPPLQ